MFYCILSKEKKLANRIYHLAAENFCLVANWCWHKKVNFGTCPTIINLLTIKKLCYNHFLCCHNYVCSVIKFVTNYQAYCIYSIKRPGHLFTFWKLRMGGSALITFSFIFFVSSSKTSRNRTEAILEISASVL